MSEQLSINYVKDQISKILVSIQGIVVITTSIGITLMICMTVVLRYFFNTDLYAIDEFEVICAFWLYFTGAAYASFTKKQITADIVTFLVKSTKTRRAISIASSFLTLVICCAFTKFSYDLIVFAVKRSQKTAVWQIPMTFMYGAIIVGFVLMTLYCIRDFWQNIMPERGN
jgi:TRAP-type C4-dicarboxylate transport system permease small subunit